MQLALQFLVWTGVGVFVCMILMSLLIGWLLIKDY